MSFEILIENDPCFDSSGGISWDTQTTNCLWVGLGKVTKVRKHMIDQLIFSELDFLLRPTPLESRLLRLNVTGYNTLRNKKEKGRETWWIEKHPATLHSPVTHHPPVTLLLLSELERDKRERKRVISVRGTEGSEGGIRGLPLPPKSLMTQRDEGKGTGGLEASLSLPNSWWLREKPPSLYHHQLVGWKIKGRELKEGSKVLFISLCSLLVDTNRFSRREGGKQDRGTVQNTPS